jgi:hypothetical protein
VNTEWLPAVNVQCGVRYLMSVPITINDKPVSVLNVSFNVLKTLEDDELFNYKSERYRYIQYFKQGIINDKEFRVWSTTPSQLFPLTALIQSHNLLTDIISYSSRAFS